MSTFNFTLEPTLVKGAVESEVFPTVIFSDAAINLDSQKDVNIPALAVDSQVSLDGLTARHLIAKFSGTCSVKINSTSNTAQTLTPSANSPAALIIVGGAVTALYVTNPGGSAIQCELFIASE